MKLTLGIETSCDDTSIALLESSVNHIPKILDIQLFNQEKILQKFGGVVPEIASRNHSEKIPFLLEEIFNKTSYKVSDVTSIAVTTHPGLIGPLLTGINAAKTLSLIHLISINPINHIFAHIEAIFLSQSSKSITYPYLGIAVSGGHSVFYLVKSSYDFELLGTTIDDAAGEAFDKGGKILNLPYPAGKLIDQYASKGDPFKFKFPIGLKDKRNAMLSYSGLKTSLKEFSKKNPEIEANKSSSNFFDLCASYQHAIVKALELKLKFALIKAKKITNQNNIPIVVGGGVACNSYLRNILSESYHNIYFVPPEFCTDNAAMIAGLAIRTPNNSINFPSCLEIDASSRIINKKEHIQ